MKTTSFTARARMRTPMALAGPLHLDGLVFAAKAAAEGVEMVEDILDILSHDGTVYRASAGFVLDEGFFGPAKGSVTVVKSPAAYFRSGTIVPTMVEAKKLVNVQGFRQYATYEGVDSVLFTGSGDPDALRDVLDCVGYLGGLHNRGYGEISAWEIEATDDDPATSGLYAEGFGVLRTLPRATAEAAGWRDFGNTSRSQERIAPPYWSKEDLVDCVSPRLESLIMSAASAEAALDI